MAYDPDIENFFRELRNAKAASDEAEKTAPKDNPQQIVMLTQADGDVVARHISANQVDGEYRQEQTGEIFFYGSYDGTGRWYVNKNMSSFRIAAAAFNRCCEFLCKKDERDAAAFTGAISQLRAELEAIEPLGDPKTSLWAVTILDPDGGGLLSLY